MHIQPISTVRYINNEPKPEPSFKMREIYYGHAKEEILEGTVNKFKSTIKSSNQIQDMTNYILTKYFSWYSPTRLNGPAQSKETWALRVLSLGMSDIMTAIKKEADRTDAKELAAVAYDRIIRAK